MMIQNANRLTHKGETSHPGVPKIYTPQRKALPQFTEVSLDGIAVQGGEDPTARLLAASYWGDQLKMAP